MSHDPESTLRPLLKAAPDVAALRAAPAAAAVVRVARAAEAALRRMLRDDPTAPVELRLSALSPDDLATDELVAELRRRDRLPVELAAAFHELTTAALRLASTRGQASPRDAELAVGVADALEAHVRAHPLDSPLEDPLLARDETLIPPHPHDPDHVHAVPAATRDRDHPAWLLPAVALLGGVVLVALLVGLLTGRGDGDALARAEEAYRKGDTAQAVTLFRDAAEDDPEAPLPRMYLAQIYRQQGRADAAARELRAGLAAAPRDPGLNVELGFLLLQQNRPVDAVQRFRTAVLADSTSTRAWGGLVTALRRSGNTAQAERILARAPADVRALLGRADGIP